MFHVPNEYRIRVGDFGTTDAYGNNGGFLIPSPTRKRRTFQVFASDGLGWEHISVCVRIGTGAEVQTPLWEEMQYLKQLFWDAEDVVMQLHPAEKNYVNMAANVLHLWRPVGKEIPVPPVEMV